MALKQAPQAPTPSAPKEDPIKAQILAKPVRVDGPPSTLPQNNHNDPTPEFTYG